MKFYVKVRLMAKQNGLFKANGILIKNEDLSKFCLVIAGEFNLPGLEVSPSDGGVNLESSSAITSRCYELPVSSFISAQMYLNLHSLGDYEIIISDEVFQINDVFSIQFDSLFNVEAREAVAISGVAVKPGYTQRFMYSGMGGYHHHQLRNQFNTPVENDKPWRIGVELELYANNEDCFNRITNARSNWFQCERDGSLNEHSYAIELKSIPLKACDAKDINFWREPLDKLSKMAKSKQYRSTGLHVHIGKEVLGDTEAERRKTIDKLLFFYTYHIEEIPQNHEKNVIICGRATGYSSAKPTTVLGDFALKVGLKHVQEIESAFNDVASGIVNAARNQRADINLGHLDDYGTIEFRKGKGAISKTRMSAIVSWWEQMCLYCRYTDARDLDFNAFFAKVCAENPTVSYFFVREEEV